MSKRPSAEEGSGMDTIKEELVRFDNVKSSYYTEAARVTLTYTLTSNIPSTPHDWIGLFPLHRQDRQDTCDPLAFTWAAPKSKAKKKKKQRGNNEGDRRQVEFPLEDASDNIITDSKKHRYQFVYVSKSGKLCGQSRAFSIQGEELWNLADDDDEFSRLSSLLSSPTTVRHDSEISILSRSQATSIGCQSESPVLLSYPSDVESEGGDVTGHEDWDNIVANATTTDGHEEKNKVVGGDNRRVSETALSEFSDIEILSTSPSKDDYSSSGCRYNNGGCDSGSSPGMGVGIAVYPEDDFNLCDIKISSGNHFGLLSLDDEMGWEDDRDKESDESERSFTRKSNKRKKKGRNAEESSGNNGVSGGAIGSDKLEDTDEISQRLDSPQRCKKDKKKKKTEDQKSKVDSGIFENNADDISEKSSKSLSGKSKNKKSKLESKEDISKDNKGPRVDEINDCMVTICNGQSKKSRKEKMSKNEKARVHVESIPSPPVLYSSNISNISRTVAEQLKFLEVEDDIKSIRLSDVEGDEKEEGREEPVCVMSRKQKRKMRKMKGEKASTDNKALIVELNAEEDEMEDEMEEEEENEKKAAVKKEEAQVTDRITAGSARTNGVIPRQETIRGKKSKRKNTDRREVDTESTSDASRESDTSTIGSHDKSTRTHSVKVTSLDPDNKSTSDNDGNAAARSSTDNGKNKGCVKKVPKNQTNGMLLYFESPVDIKHETDSSGRNETKDSKVKSKTIANTNQQENATSGNDSKLDKKSKRSKKSEPTERVNSTPTIIPDDIETTKEKKVELIELEVADTSQCENIDGQKSKRSKKSKSLSKDNMRGNEQSERSVVEKTSAQEINNKAKESDYSNMASALEHLDVEQLISDGKEDSKPTKSHKKTKRKNNDISDVLTKPSEEEKVPKEKHAQVQQPSEKAKDKTKKIPRTIATVIVEAHRSQTENDLDKTDKHCDRYAIGSDANRDKNRIETTLNIPIPINQRGDESEFKTKVDDDIVNNNVIFAVRQATLSEQSSGQDKGKKKHRKTKNKSVGNEETINGNMTSQEDMATQSTCHQKWKSKEISVAMGDVSLEGVVLTEHADASQSESRGDAEDDSITPVVENAFSGSGTIDRKRQEIKEGKKRTKRSSDEVTVENAENNYTKKERKVLVKIDNYGDEIATILCKDPSESKRVSFISNKDKDNSEIESKKADNSCTGGGLIKTKRVSSLEFGEAEWAISDKENAKASMRNKLYLAKKEKMKAAAIKAKINKKERRSKGKSEKIIMLKELFEESFSSPIPNSSEKTCTLPQTGTPYDTVVVDNPDTRPAAVFRLSSSHAPSTSTTALGGIKRPQIPAYLLDVIDDLPEDPDTPNFLEWRKSMAYGKPKGQSQDCDADNDQQTTCKRKKEAIGINIGGDLKTSDSPLDDVAALKGRKRGKVAMKDVLPPSPLATIMTARVDDNDDDVDDDEDDEKRYLALKKTNRATSGFGPLMSYANVLKGLSASLNKAKINENLGFLQRPSNSRETTNKSSSKCHRRGKQLPQQQQLADDRKMLIRARRAIFSPGYKNLFNAALETQCYLLDKVEGRLMGRHPQFSRRTKLRAASKIKMEKQKHKKLIQTRLQRRRQKEVLNAGMLSTALVPMCTSLACEPSGSYSLTSNESNESVSSVRWPLPVKLSIDAHDQENKINKNNEAVAVTNRIQPCCTWMLSGQNESNDDDDDDDDSDDIMQGMESYPSTLKEMMPLDEKSYGIADNSTALASSSTDNEENVLLRQLESLWSVEKMDLQDVPMSTRMGDRCKSMKSRRLPGYSKSLDLAHLVQQRLKSEVKVKDREIASLENQVNCLKEVVKRQSKQEIKTRFKLIAIKRKYNILKATRAGQRAAVVEHQGLTSSNDEEFVDGLVKEPPCKKRKLGNADTASQGAQTTGDISCCPEMPMTKEETFPLDLRKDDGKKMPVHKSPRLYPDIQKELSDLQKEVGKHSDEEQTKPEQHRCWYPFVQEEPSTSKDETSFVFRDPIPMAQAAPGGLNDAPNHSANPFNTHGKYHTDFSNIDSQYQSFQILNPNHFENLPPKTRIKPTEFLQQQQQQQREQPPPFSTRPTNHHVTLSTQPQFDQIPFPAATTTPQPYPPPRNNPFPNPFSPPKLPLLPTPTQTTIPPFSHPDPTRPIPVSLNQMGAPPPNVATPTSPSGADRAAARGYSCPPNQRSRSPMVVYHQTSPLRKRQPSHPIKNPTTFGNQRYTPLTNNSQPATMMVAPRPRHFNRPFPCNGCRQCPYAGNSRTVFDGTQREAYSEYPVGIYPYNQEAKSPEKIIYFVPENNAVSQNATRPCYFSHFDGQPDLRSSSNYFTDYPHASPNCESRQDCNCCHNNYHLSYQQ